jgi:hypothetical protein
MLAKKQLRLAISKVMMVSTPQTWMFPIIEFCILVVVVVVVVVVVTVIETTKLVLILKTRSLSSQI